MDIRITNLHRADLFAALFQHIKLFTEHITLLFDQEKMYLQTMDSARVSIIECTLPAAWFDHYEHSAPSTVAIGLHATSLFKILSTRDKAQEIRISYSTEDSDRLYFHFTCPSASASAVAVSGADPEEPSIPPVRDPAIRSVFDKHFELPLMEIDYEMMHIPVTDCQAEFSILSSTFASLVTQLKLFGDTLVVDCSEEKIQLHSLSVETGKMSVEININDLTEFTINEGETMNLSFSLGLLHHICMYNKLSKEVIIQLTTNFPMKVTYDLDDQASMVFYLAPRINDD
jgi:DNA polymerase III sliding clamp (beta) subunit (PCNA family)